jgi:hypothetical protein
VLPEIQAQQVLQELVFKEHKVKWVLREQQVIQVQPEPMEFQVKWDQLDLLALDYKDLKVYKDKPELPVILEQPVPQVPQELLVLVYKDQQVLKEIRVLLEALVQQEPQELAFKGRLG